MANNETYTCSPSEVFLSDSDSELLIPTPWSDESKNENKAKRYVRQEFEWKRSLLEIDFMFGINAFDLDKEIAVMINKVKQENEAVIKGWLLMCSDEMMALRLQSLGVMELVDKGRPLEEKGVYAE
ncbi:hypothetical protein Tco_0489960 [Tanacetum coccineum]